jgi:hypothetical protein
MSNQSDREQFSNLSNGVPLSIEEMCRDLRTLTQGQPFVVSGQLSYVGSHGVEPIESSAALLAWINHFAQVHWARSGSAVSKEEFYHGLYQLAYRYEWASAYPHFPPLANVLYTCPAPQPNRTGALDELVTRFTPASSEDWALIKAAFLTPFWGGPPGTRPMFVVVSGVENDSNEGRGVGKTTLVEMVGRLVGGYISVHPSAGDKGDRMISDLLSPLGQQKRALLIDNLKTTRFSNEIYESMVTASEVNGHHMYKGLGSRPNYLTWFVTVNGAAASKDIAQRSVVIKLGRPTYHRDWAAQTLALIDGRRNDLLADIAWLFAQPPMPISQVDRWGPWTVEVLGRVGRPSGLLVATIGARRQEIDADDQEATLVIDHIGACIRSVGFNPDVFRIWIPSLQLIAWIQRLRPDMKASQVSHLLGRLGQRLSYSRTGRARGYVWTGPHAGPEGPIRDITNTPDVGRTQTLWQQHPVAIRAPLRA